MAEISEAVPKKIIVCCDGTWQSSVTGKHNLPSNITRLARTIAKSGKDVDGKQYEQIVYYDAGVGTGALTRFESDRQGATGDGLVTNVLEAYNFVVNNYSPGDKVYCFGFSRGAFTARAIAGMITDFGVIKPDNMKHFAPLFTAYQTNIPKYNFRRTKEYFEWYKGKAPLVPESQKNIVQEIPWYEMGCGDVEWPNSRQIEVVGVFDTVGSLGLSDSYFGSNASSRRKFEWLNVKWNPYIKHAFHALALDDRRQMFLPTLYYIPNDDVVAAENKLLEKEEVDWPELTEHRRRIDAELEQQKNDHKPDLIQVWFTGVHINVGGGTDDAKTDFEGLANITFAWMVEQCRPYLAFEPFTNQSIATYLQQMREDAAEQEMRKQEESATGVVNQAVEVVNGSFKWIASLFKSTKPAVSGEKLVRTYNFNCKGEPNPSPAHWTCFRVQDSYSLMYEAISGPATRTPGACDDRSSESHYPFTKLGRTNEYMHPSVQWRVHTSMTNETAEFQYKSKALVGFEHQQKDGVWGWYKKNGDIWVPEWPITAALEAKAMDKLNSELSLVDHCLDKAHVRKMLKLRATACLQAQPKTT